MSSAHCNDIRYNCLQADESSDTSDDEEEMGGDRDKQATPTPTTVSEIETESSFTSTSVSQLDQDYMETPPSNTPLVSQSESSVIDRADQSDQSNHHKSQSDSQINIGKRNLRSASKSPRRGVDSDVSQSDGMGSDTSSGYQTLSKKQ